MSQLVVEDVTKHYPTRAEPLEVLRGVSLTLDAGQSLAVLGPSGSGKSTLLQVLGTLDRPTTGRVLFDSRDPFALDEPELADFRNKHIGFVFQDHHLLPQLSALENTLLPAVAAGRPTVETIERARQLLDDVGLSERTDHRPAELSGGERQRVALARALLLRPTLLLADEPTGNLDRTTALSVGRLLLDLQRKQAAMLIVVTHSLELAELFEQRRELDQGRLQA